jgi:hypothetical protein
MTYPCRYLARLDNPLIIKAWGYTEAGGLGDVDPNVYTEVEGPLPAGYTLEPEPLTTGQRLAQLGEVFNNLPLTTQYSLRQAMSEVATAAQANNLALMHCIIEQATITPDLEPVRQTMLGYLAP